MDWAFWVERALFLQVNSPRLPDKSLLLSIGDGTLCKAQEKDIVRFIPYTILDRRVLI